LTVTQTGYYNITLIVKDQYGQTINKSFTLVVSNYEQYILTTSNITLSTLPQGCYGILYVQPYLIENVPVLTNGNTINLNILNPYYGFIINITNIGNIPVDNLTVYLTQTGNSVLFFYNNQPLVEIINGINVGDLYPGNSTMIYLKLIPLTYGLSSLYLSFMSPVVTNIGSLTYNFVVQAPTSYSGSIVASEESNIYGIVAGIVLALLLLVK
jgi:hypothetical protein